MLKKVIVGILIVAVIALAGWKIFFTKDDVSKSLENRSENLTAYHMEATMDMNAGDDVRNYYVTTDYQKKDNQDYFRVSLLNKSVNQEQILLRNDKGVFMLTPTLNQVYQFKGEWPLNSPKPYLYHSKLDGFKEKHDLKKMDDGYLLSFKPNYENAPNWEKEEVKLSKDLKPLWVNIYDASNQAEVKIAFSKVDFEPTFEENYFDVDKNMEEARKNLSSSTMATQDDLPLYPAGADVSCVLKEETETMVNGETTHILTYEGTKSFTVIQSIMKPNEEMRIDEIKGTMVDVLGTIGYMNGKYLSYAYNGVSYQIYSSSLSVAEMVEIAAGMEVVTMK